MIADWYAGAVHKSLILKAIFLVLVVAGCAVQPLVLDPGVDFRVTGKFGVRDGDDGYSARFTWAQSFDAYDIEVWGPLGQGRTRLSGDSNRMTVLQGEEVLAVGTPEEVMAASLGWSVPIGVLPAWIRGRPHRQLAFGEVVRDAEDRFVEFVQAGWQVELSRYADEEENPGRIVATRGDRRVTVIVRDYAESDDALTTAAGPAA